MFLLWATFIWRISLHVYEAIKSGNEWHAEVDGRGLIKQDFYFFVFLYVCIYFMTWPESSSYNCQFCFYFNLKEVGLQL